MKNYHSKIFQSILLVLLTFWTFKLLNKEYLVLIESVDLILHEAGHLILMFFGETIGFLGGTLGQLFFPIAFTVYFFLRKEFYSTLVMTWWIGENFADIGIYMSDARSRLLPLLGGEGSIHDWWFLFGKFNILKYDLIIGSFFWHIGITLMFGSLFFSFLLLYKKHLLKLVK